MGRELQALKVTSEMQEDFKDKLKTWKENTLGKKHIKKIGQAAIKELSKKKYPAKIPQWKTSSDDLPQSEAKLLMPPGSSIWRANYVGSWQVHVPPHPRHSEAWAKHQQSSHKAMIAAVTFAWQQWLDDKDLSKERCPIAGLF